MRNRNCKERMRACAPVWRAALGLMAIAVAVLPPRVAAQMNTTTVQGTVYRADGKPASGTLLLNWSAFTTPQNQAVAAGNLSAPIGADGFVSLNLTPNASALPAGSYYTAVYHLNDGTVNQEYWVVPATATATIAAVRAQLEPSTVAAVQGVSQAYVQSALASLSGSWLPLAGGAMSGPLTLNADPAAQNQAATKHYADQLAAAQLPLSGGTLTGPLTAPNIYAKQLEGHLYADQWQSSSGSNNGIAMTLAQCASLPYACQIIAPETYALTEAPASTFTSAATPKGTCFTDYRTGGPQVSCIPAPSTTWEWNDNRHSLGPSFTTDITWPLTGNSNHPAPGLSVGTNAFYGPFNFSLDQSAIIGEILNSANYASGSMNDLNMNLYALGNGDHIGILNWIQSYGGISAGDNEGNENKDVITEGPDVFEGTINSISTTPASSSVCTSPCTVFNTTRTQGIYGNALGDGLALIDITHGDSTGYISSAWNPIVATGADWDATYGVSNAHTTLTAAIAQGSTNLFPETNPTIAVASSTGFVTGTPACIFDADGLNWDCSNVTVVGTNTLTLGEVHAPFSNGSVVAQGGMTGMGFTLQADWVIPGNTKGIAISDAGLVNTIRPTWPIEYNVAGATATLFSGTRGGYSASATRAYTTMGSGGTASATVSGGVVTSCAVSGGSGYSSGTGGYGGGIPQLVLTVNSGATPPVLAVNWIGNTSLSSCAVISGGSGITSISVAVSPQNPYAVYPMAHLLNVWNPVTGQVDGSSLAVDSPMGTFSVGDTVEAPHYYATAVTGANQHYFDYQPGAERLRRAHRVVRRNNRRKSLRRLDHQRQQHVALSGIAVVIRSQPVCPRPGPMEYPLWLHPARGLPRRSFHEESALRRKRRFPDGSGGRGVRRRVFELEPDIFHADRPERQQQRKRRRHAGVQPDEFHLAANRGSDRGRGNEPVLHRDSGRRLERRLLGNVQWAYIQTGSGGRPLVTGISSRSGRYYRSHDQRGVHRRWHELYDHQRRMECRGQPGEYQRTESDGAAGPGDLPGHRNADRALEQRLRERAGLRRDNGERRQHTNRNHADGSRHAEWRRVLSGQHGSGAGLHI